MIAQTGACSENRTLESLLLLSNVVHFTIYNCFKMCSCWIIHAPSWVAGKCSVIRKRMTRICSRGNAKQNVPVLNYLGERSPIEAAEKNILLSHEK